ncbi:response regulator transcription factor [Arthrobacter crystallopoietes]|jgi:DNA-binding NarL/FixJ family response regulator|uniref:DNA-binding response regulator, NarL/FixJ family, contains REC and HTH domains n=1 Tax=Crystallibacter crystallopoietes TaxID=37928 RepID=A0A1H1A1Q5_9MICC|nr:response regulator transcription factor [Arthrobacter crystallopoietes]AUI51732.1 hypothetical protein AC20117_13925 [Arthrobacter crystallopoietes]SDQ33216.1 DNA-binding response regulator, NarL/FixJ family, contains REC and HTH domains [Arthrobacter crystallopoietes]
MTEENARDVARVVVVDDHTTFAELLSDALDRQDDLENAGIAGSAKDGVELCRSLEPDVVVMDYHLPDGNGLDAAEQILAHNPLTRVIVLTGDPSPEILGRAAITGICGFLPKDGSLATLLDTLRHARTGSLVIHPSLLAIASRASASQPADTPSLTERERQVLGLMAAGHDVRANAKHLGITENTCRGYVKSILAKLDAHTQLEAVAVAGRLGLLTADRDG